MIQNRVKTYVFCPYYHGLLCLSSLLLLSLTHLVEGEGGCGHRPHMEYFSYIDRDQEQIAPPLAERSIRGSIVLRVCTILSRALVQALHAREQGLVVGTRWTLMKGAAAEREREFSYLCFETARYLQPFLE